MQSPCFYIKVGKVTEYQTKKYIENQSDKPGSFKIWDESPDHPQYELGK
jgi:hypothetical protein